MPNEVLRKVGDQLCFRDSTDFNPAAANDLTQSPTNVQIDCTSLADAAARQSDKIDLGARRAPAYAVMAAFEIAATPTAGDLIELYWAPSPDATAANGNPGGVSGADAAYAGYSANLAASVKQLQLIGTFVCTAQATGTIQIAFVGVFSPTERYGTLVVKNESAAAFHSDMVETHVVFDPVIDEVQ